MKKIIFIILFYLTFKVSAQKDFILEKSYYNNFLYFLPSNDDLITLVTKQFYSKGDSSYYNKNIIVLLSRKNGNIIKEIPLSENDKSIFAFNISHDGMSFVLMSSSSGEWYKNEGNLTIKKYLLDENRWAWEKEWYDDVPCLKLTYDEDDKKINCVTQLNTLIIDAETGILIKRNNSISSIFDSDLKFSRFELSKNGKYFAYWKRKYRTFSYGDDLGFYTAIDMFWYGIKWLFYLGSIPNNLYIWDIKQDKLYEEISIPYEAIRGIPFFSSDEKKIIIGPFDGKYKIYSIPEKKLIREFFQKESVYDSNNDERLDSSPDFRVISSDSNLIAICLKDNSVFLVDSRDGNLVHQFKQTSLASPTIPHIGESYAMAFSSDGKYFSVVTESNKINLYGTKDQELIWQVKIPSEKK
ncbi:MAG: hypothetical protein C4539_00330 [Ignavibacteriales bacterium]|nr:MAG: hypothetical protein C4539_00330 [Ignavibacteriales bacterium]